LDEVWLVALDPTSGAEIQKTRPCLIISPNEMNRHLRTLIIAPMTTAERPYPTRVAITFQGKRGQVARDQLRAIDRQRLVRKLGSVSESTAVRVSTTLIEMFARQ
jgi:mRNA interferase MazF